MISGAVRLGRTGRIWACERWGVAPDLLVAGKGLSGGVYPIAACCFGDRVDGFLVLLAVAVGVAAAYLSWEFLLVVASMIVVAAGLGYLLGKGIGDTIRVWIIDADGTRVQIDGETYLGAGPEPGQEIQQIVDSIEFE